MSGYDAMIFVAFVGLVSATLANRQSRHLLRHKSRHDWLLDSCGLMVQGLLVPLLQTMLYGSLHLIAPQLQAAIHLPDLATFLLSFVFVDYLYYWNHRWLHDGGWRWHQVHHTVTEMDVLGTSRNSLWTSSLIIYLWIHPLLLYGVDHPAGYLLGVSLTAVLDLWRHSCFNPPPSWCRWLSLWLVLPQDHAWHHAASGSNDVNNDATKNGAVNYEAVNYGANLKWDRWYGTSYAAGDAMTRNAAGDIISGPTRLGIPLKMALWQKLLLPSCR